MTSLRRKCLSRYPKTEKKGTRSADILGNDIQDRRSSKYESPERVFSWHVIVSTGD